MGIVRVVLHAGEEALFVLVPVAIVLWLDYRQRRKAEDSDEQDTTDHSDEKSRDL